MNDYIFDFVYKMAMNDATMQKAYDESKDKLLECKELKECVKNYIKSIFSSEYPEFNDTAEKALSIVKGYPSFTFGNVQKLINMTAKYFFISTYNDPNKRVLFKECHCPMDKIMIEKIVAEYKRLIKDDLEQKDKKLEYYVIENGKETCDWSNVCWSKLVDYYTGDIYSRLLYEKYQEMVKYITCDKIMPLEVDFIYFNRQKESLD